MDSMKYERIEDKTKTQPIALPRYFEGSEERAVLVLHGFKGMTANMVHLSERLAAEGFTVSAPRLPGHGTSFEDFHTSGWQDWLRRSIDAYQDLRASHPTVYVTGLSMGGVLSLILASLFEVERIALCAPALKVDNRLISLTPLLRFLVPRIATNHVEESEDPQRIYLSEEYWRYHTSVSVYQLYRLQRYARRRLSRVHADTLTIVSKADRSVPAGVVDLIEGGIASEKKRRVVLEESSHVMTESVEKERVADEVAAWFR